MSRKSGTSFAWPELSRRLRELLSRVTERLLTPVRTQDKAFFTSMCTCSVGGDLHGLRDDQWGIGFKLVDVFLAVDAGIRVSPPRMKMLLRGCIVVPPITFKAAMDDLLAAFYAGWSLVRLPVPAVLVEVHRIFEDSATIPPQFLTICPDARQCRQ